MRATLPSIPLPWPAPALLLWLACGLLQALLLRLDAPPAVALATSVGLGVLAALLADAPWRRWMLALGWPALSLAGGLSSGVPAWAWLLPLALLLLAYPLRAWRDAPMFPTPAQALDGLAERVPLPVDARVRDAGCGMGHGLQALRAVYPQARLEGIEWSLPLRLYAGLRCPWARVRRGDLWADGWQGLAMVYVFQRPESMERVWAKACAELAPGAWLVSLAFEVPGQPPAAQLPAGPARRHAVWIYRVPAEGAARPSPISRKTRSGQALPQVNAAAVRYAKHAQAAARSA
ncbi:class I SAM-dependent methyltransferase [Leptothrix discophora]|uniref:Class I SAM-dependent methyltransferase n=1 Tax=Leptothrix discophora TaxID=89 RepID=A0ABT9G6C5_LEPDI|nr:class I SAM-dependent methyltransferase [Leptothrix discophora]MDP4302034.1 class I SAM-dependent methyltransferase [Leptothrix discophora]